VNLDVPGQGISFRLIRPLVGFKSQLEEQLEKYHYEDNVFLMMRFKKANQALSDFMIETLSEAGLRGVRADAKEWDVTGDVYNPLAVLYCCKYGIALFDEPMQHQAYNPNVIYELAIMHYQEKSCLILRHAKLPEMPFDLIKNLYVPYDRDLAIRENIRTWIAKIRPAGETPESELPVAADPEERREIRTPGDTIAASEFRWEVRGRGKTRDVAWRLKLANDGETTKRPKIRFILMAEDGFMLSDYTTQLKALEPGEARVTRSTFKVPGNLARRLARVMVICEGEAQGS